MDKADDFRKACEEFRRTCDEKHISDRGRIERLEETTNRIFEVLDKYKERPTWIVLLIISGLGTTSGAMLMYIITHGR